MDRPLMLWCSSHSTLAQEEMPLFLEAGFRVIPLLTDFWTFKYDANLDNKICSQWKQSVDLPAEVIKKLQALSFCDDSGRLPFQQEEIDLLNRYVDVVYVTVLPNLAIRLSKAFHGTVIFRPFGHGALNNYSNISRHLGTSTQELQQSDNFHWVPILTSLQEIETPKICMNATHLGAYVTEERLGNHRWNPATSEPYVVETIPRINKQPYYFDIYQQYRKDHGHLPLKILGGNQPNGGDIGDSTIVGFLSDDEYYSAAAKARVSIYHGRSRYHIHYHPIEFMAMGVPVLFHEESAFVSEAMHFGITTSELLSCGMYRSVQEANAMAESALRDPEIALQWSQRQRIFLHKVFSRDLALNQARWLKTRVVQAKIQSNLTDDIQPSVSVKKRPLIVRVGKELERAWKRRIVKPLSPKLGRELSCQK
jgi:hypothetical protein